MGGALAGRRALVTGAAGGIGAAVSAELVAAGAGVLMADRNAAALQAVADGLRQPAWSGDLTDAGAGDEVVAAAVGALGGLDIIINNAGAAADAPVHRMTDEAFAAMLALHATAPFRVLRAATAELKRSAAGGTHAKVVNVSSIIGTMGGAGGANYAAAKAGLVGLTKSLAKEWGPHGVCVNAIAFGYIDTDLSAGLPERVRDAARASIALGRFGTTREAAGAIAFLCGPASDYVTGEVLTVSGGAQLGMAF